MRCNHFILPIDGVFFIVPYTTHDLLRRVRDHYLAEHHARLILAAVCMMIAALTGAGNAWLLQPALDDMFINKKSDLLLLIPFAYVILATTGGITNYAQTMLMRHVGQSIVAKMQVELFRHLVYSDVGLFHSQSSGRLVSRFTNDIQMMRQAVSSVLAGLAKEFISLIVLIGLMCYQSWELTLLALIAFPVAIYPILRLGKRMRRVADGIQKELGEFTNTLDETFSNVHVVKAYGREEYEIEKAQHGIMRLFTLYMKASKVQAAASPMMEAVGAIGVAIVLGYGGYQVLHGENSPGGFFSFIAAMMMAYRPLRTLSGLNNQLQEGLASAQRLFAVLDKKPSIADSTTAQPLHVPHGDIVMEEISFNYEEQEHAIKRASLIVPAGKMVALVGSSGSGKSTLMNLLLRFYDCSSGNIWIDGQDIRDVTLASLRHSIAIVSQDVMLFDDSVANNIAYGRLDASRESIMHAARMAAAHDFIMDLPQGYDTKVGPAGVKLSGGQRQRLCIARAFLKDAPILLLDEATSSLDSQSEHQVQQALSTLMQSRTSLVIAHRLSTILHADHIYVLHKGMIVEHGTHSSLLAKNGHYARLYHRQFERSGIDEA
ncbi:MAG: ABC transporter ATP-binding protein [Alphaproteobacteria bacterium]|nr:MAG: ABC transporter ATP-binding protein [Alphaproteobacteria bacterium]TAF13813.1 MAG: ABC transporter ATP-binding protein [Alphaproteobacteria bacterium]TAF41234.1 MAG: ABC transporter ATP-binding protein [Alphaproteobacteria bacterium]TAF75113.1 MAG: ABC transporter ATP-binding protein [Alphaproteobacteria bacterium]